MADILLDVQGPPATPAAGQAIIFVDSTSKKLSVKDDAGKVTTTVDLLNASVSAQGAGFAADTYLVGSSVPLLSAAPRVGTLYQCTFDVSKSAAGVVAPVLILRVGTAGSVADAARCTFTFPAQTAIADVGLFTVWALFRAVGAAGVLQGRASLTHKGTATGLTGLSIEPGPVVQITSAGFDTTVANLILGLSVNGGTSAAWTVQLVEAMVSNI